MARDIYGFGWHQNSAMKYGCAKSVRVSRRFEYNPEWFHSINIVRKTLLIHASNVRNKAANISMKFTPKNLLITGGVGFIGSNFINYVYNKWPSCRIINIDKDDDKFGYSFDEERYVFIKNDIQNIKILTHILHLYQIDAVIHFAAITHVDESYANRIGTITENIVSTSQLLEAVTIHYNGIERFVHISTDEVYGDSQENEDRKDEKSNLNPTNPYAASKASCELILQAYSHSYKLPFVMVRMNNVYGPRQQLSKLIPKFINIAMKNGEYPLMGDGLHSRSWMFVDDCCEGIKRVMESGRLGEIYNLGTDFEISNYDVTIQIHQLVSKLLNRDSTSANFCFIADRPYHDRRYLINFNKVETEMNWKCTTDFRDGLYKTIQYYINDYERIEKFAKLKQG
ncbi:unnamed protein product [Dracunculus medinensis]|uniref:dTDP-D-glucose 4,6-dehydratase n=1 Tax=Dracunculus medinensis TaxID=318479 RepID=A0A0N4UNN8_DRAME|nr:unnamed protein product [Dracunculus medinensis]